jgi:hypothetical protein
MDWLATNRQRLLETLDVEPGVGERMQDILSGDDPQFPLVEKDLAKRRTRAWLDTPDKDGLTPHQAAQTTEGRAKLQEHMKLLEFIHDQALKAGSKPPLIIEIIRKELGLSSNPFA